MAKELHIARSGTVAAKGWPLDAVTRTFGVLGQRGTGKTSAAVVMVEEMVRCGGHAAVLDPVGVWWGITRQGRNAGLPGIVIGGEHGDVPLEEGAGQLVAELVVGRHWPVVVIDLKLLRKGAQIRFMADYLETLYHLNRQPLHQVFEEADRAMPQGRVIDPHQGRCVGAGEDIVKLGRSRGLGATLVTQRPATLNKNALEVCESLLLFRLLGTNDRKAAKGWIEANGDASKTATVMDSLAQLKLGECWLWSPSFLETLGRIKIRERKTFDSSATPEVGAAVPDDDTKRAPVDLDELRERMAETVERQKANDPRELKKQIAELTKQLDAQPVEAQVIEQVEVEVLVPDPEAISAFGERVDELTRFAHDLGDRIGEVESVRDVLVEVRGEAAELLATATARLTQLREMDRTPVEQPPEKPESGGVRTVPAGRDSPSPAAPRPADANGALTAGEVKLLEVLARHHPLKLKQVQLATLARRGKKSSTLDQHLANLASSGLIVRESGVIAATADGLARVGHTPSNESPADTWRSALPEGPRDLLDVLLRSPRQQMSKAELAAEAGVSATSSTTDEKLKLLRDNGLVRVSGGLYELTDLLD